MSRILVAGGAGFLGSRVVDELRSAGATHIRVPRSAATDLRERDNCRRVVECADVVIHRRRQSHFFGRRAYAAAQRERIAAQVAALGGRVVGSDQPLDYALKLDIEYDGALKLLEDRVEALGGIEIVSLGRSMELIKDVGLALEVAAHYHLDAFQGTHAIGHTRMATESAVDISHAHPFWAYPFPDIAVVHNGQITNYHKNRHLLEREGHRFRSHCDSELIAVYMADKLSAGLSLEEALHQSQQDLDGVYTYIVCTENEIGVAKDELAAKPLRTFVAFAYNTSLTIIDGSYAARPRPSARYAP